MTTATLPPGNPPDYISIPEHLRTRSANVVAGSRRMHRLFERANIRVLGDLDGKRLSDFAAYPGCNNGTLRELRWLLLRFLHRIFEPDLTTWPILMCDYRPPGPAFQVPLAIHDLSPHDFPVSIRLENVLRRLGIERMGQLDGLPIRKLLMTHNCGRHTLDELNTLLRRAEAGEFGLPEEGQSRTLSDRTPPDYISIPEDLKATPVEGPGLPERLRSLLRGSGIRLLGDLDGKRLSDFEEYLESGKGAISALRLMIIRAIHPGVLPDRRTRPILVRYWWPPERAIEVARPAGDLWLKDLPVSVRLEGVLRDLGIERLGQLQGLPILKLLVSVNCGAKTLAELRTLLRRAEAGEFTLAQEKIASSTPSDLLRHIDDLVSHLSEQHRAFLILRFGASGQEPLTFRQIGQQHGLTGSAVGAGLSRAIGSMRREGSLRLRTLLEYVDSACASSHARLSPALVSTWQDPAHPFEHSPQFYVGLISKLNLRLADNETKGESITRPGLPASAGAPAGFMSKDCVTVREVEGVG